MKTQNRLDTGRGHADRSGVLRLAAPARAAAPAAAPAAGRRANAAAAAAADGRARTVGTRRRHRRSVVTALPAWNALLASGAPLHHQQVISSGSRRADSRAPAVKPRAPDAARVRSSGSFLPDRDASARQLGLVDPQPEARLRRSAGNSLDRHRRVLEYRMHAR